jgi:SAM-dependent methyltransferase
MRFAFMNAVAERILVKPDQLAGRLASEEEGRHADAMHEYGILKKSYQNLHRYDHEDWAFYRFKVNQRRAKPCSWLRPFGKLGRFCDWLFLDVGCGYGTHPGRAVRMALLIIVGFAVLYAVRADMFYAEKLPFDGEKTDPANRIMIGFITSVSVFTSGMGGIREIAKDWMNVPVMIESIMGTLLFGLFIVAFSRKVIR